MNVGNLYRVGIACWLNGQIGLIIKHYRVRTIAGGGAADQDFADELYSTFGPLLQPMMNEDAKFLGCSVRNISLIPPAAAVVSTGPPLDGTVVGGELPTQVSGIITLRTIHAGRRFRGRAYVPFPAEPFNDTDAKPTPAYMLLLDDVGIALTSPVLLGGGPDTATLDPCTLAQVAGVEATIISSTPRRAWATQRRRGTFGASNPETVPFV